MRLKFFKKRERIFKKGGFHTNPDISWEVVLFLAFALAALSFVFGFFLLQEVGKEPGASELSGRGQAKIIEKERIDKALDYFSEREKRSAEISNSPSPIVDPSR